MLRTVCSAGLLAVMLVILVTGSALAQTGVNADINASANVVATLTITKNTDIAFGSISSTTAGVVFLDPKSVASNYVGSTAAVGTITISGANSQSIRVGWPANITLSNGANTLNYVLGVAGLSTLNQGSSTPLTLTGGYVNLMTSATGKYYLWVGGSLGGSATTPAPLTGQTSGAYTGTASFTVEYN